MSSPEMPKSSSGKGVSLCVRYFWASQQRWPSRSRLVVAVSAAWLCLWYCMGGSQPWLIKLQNSVSDTTVRELREELQNLKDKVAIHERRYEENVHVPHILYLRVTLIYIYAQQFLA